MRTCYVRPCSDRRLHSRRRAARLVNRLRRAATSAQAAKQAALSTTVSSLSVSYSHACAVISDGSCAAGARMAAGSSATGQQRTGRHRSRLRGSRPRRRYPRLSAHLRAAFGRYGDVLGAEQRGPARDPQRPALDASQPVAGAGDLDGDPGCGRPQPLLRAACRPDGALLGRRLVGQLGNGGTASSATPVQVTGITTATQIAAGENRTCALLASGA